MKLHVQLLTLATVALTLRPSLQQADASKECFATTTPKPGDPAVVTCMYPSDVSKVRPVSLKLEFYPWNWSNKDKVNVVDCSWATDTDTQCDRQDGYSIIGDVGTQLRIQITAMSNRTEGAYVCQRLSPDFNDTFLQTCILKFPESVPPTLGTTQASTSQGTGGGDDDSGSSNIGLIAGVAGGVGGGVALLVAVIVGVICYRRRQKHAAESKEPESESDFVAGPTEEPKPSVCSGFLQCCKRGPKSSNPATDEAGQIYSEINETAEDPLLGTRSESTSDEKPPLPKPRQNSIDTVKYTKPTTKNNRDSSNHEPKKVAIVAGTAKQPPAATRAVSGREWPPKPPRNSESSDPDLKSDKKGGGKKEDMEELMEGLKPSHLRKSSKSQATEGESKQAPARAFSASSAKEPPAALAKVGSVKASSEKEATATAAATGLAKAGSVKSQGPTGPKDEAYESLASIAQKNEDKVKEIKAKHGINPKEEEYQSLASVAAKSEAKANEIKEKHGISPTDEKYESMASILAKNEEKVKEIEAKKQARTLSSSSNKGEDGVFHTAAPTTDTAALEQMLSNTRGMLKSTGIKVAEEEKA